MRQQNAGAIPVTPICRIPIEMLVLRGGLYGTPTIADIGFHFLVVSTRLPRADGLQIAGIVAELFVVPRQNTFPRAPQTAQRLRGCRVIAVRRTKSPARKNRIRIFSHTLATIRRRKRRSDVPKCRSLTSAAFVRATFPANCRVHRIRRIRVQPASAIR